MTASAAAQLPTTPEIADLRDRLEGLVEQFLAQVPDSPEPADLEYEAASLIALLDLPPLAELAGVVPTVAERRADSAPPPCSRRSPCSPASRSPARPRRRSSDCGPAASSPRSPDAWAAWS